MRIPVILLALIAGSAHAGNVYVCKGAGGATLYSQMPCPQGTAEQEQRQFVDIAPSSDSPGRDLSAMADDVANNNRRLEAERRIRNSERRLAQLQKERADLINNTGRLVGEIAGVNAANRGQAVIDDMERSKARLDQAIKREQDIISESRKALSQSSATQQPTIRQSEY